MREFMSQSGRSIRNEFTACRVARDGLASGLEEEIQASLCLMNCLSNISLGFDRTRPGNEVSESGCFDQKTYLDRRKSNTR